LPRVQGARRGAAIARRSRAGPRRTGCLPDWTLVLGLESEVSTFNSLPPSLFNTLSSMVALMRIGCEFKPVGLLELQRYDK
jgi:hypothetical protein